MKSELLHIGPFTVYGYGAMIALGVLAAYFMMEYRARKHGLDYEKIFGLFLSCLIGGFLSAKILYFIVEWKNFIADPGWYFMNLSDGFVVYGGILGGIFCGICYCRIMRLDFLTYFDLTMPAVAAAQGFGRIGCFLSGCCYGKESTSFFTVTFTNSDMAPNHVSLIPTQIYSGILDFANCLLLLWISRKTDQKGLVGAAYLVFYSVGRFVIEFFRGDSIRGQIGILSTSQVISAGTFIIGVLLLLKCRKKMEQPD